jgi:hypothetical protein
LISSEDINILCNGYNEYDSGRNYLKTAAVLSVGSSERMVGPILDNYGKRLKVIMDNVGDIVVAVGSVRDCDYYNNNNYNEDYDYDGYNNHYDKLIISKLMKLYLEHYKTYTKKRALITLKLCHEDLHALTSYVTWDINTRTSATDDSDDSDEVIGENLGRDVSVFRLAIDDANKNYIHSKRGGGASCDINDTVMRQWKKAGGRAPGYTSFARRMTRWGSSSKQSEVRPTKPPPPLLTEQTVSVNVNTLKLQQSYDDNTIAMQLRSIIEGDGDDKATDIVNALVNHLNGKWRMQFVNMIAQKFNTFFLLSFIEDFEATLREEYFENRKKGEGNGDRNGEIENVIRETMEEAVCKLEEEIEGLEKEINRRNSSL